MLISLQTLQHNRNKLNSLLAPQRASDPLTLLPNELALMLFEYLDFKDIVYVNRPCCLQSLNSSRAMSRVSKSWRETLTSNPYLWTELDFSHARKIVSLTAVRAYVKYSKNNVIILKSSRSELDQRPSFFYVATHCHTLQELYYDQPAAGETLCRAAKAMPSLRKVSTSSRCRISLEFCLDILQSCQSLQHVEFLSVFVPGIISESPNTRELSNLRTLTLNMCGQSPNTDIERVFETITRVRCLTLQGWKFPSYLANHKEFGFSSFVYLEHLNVSRSRFDRLPSLPRSIREISFEATDFLGHGQVIDLQDLPNLIRLSLPRNHIIEKTLDLLHKLLLSGHGKLLGLDASNRHFPAGDVECLVREGYFDAINDLMLGQSGVNDAIAELLSERCKSLATLEIPHTQITGVGVKALVNGLRPSLKYLGLDYCNQVSPDAVHWARKQGLQVSYKFPDKKMKGRKVRGG